MCPGLCTDHTGRQESGSPEHQQQREGEGWPTQNLGEPDLQEPFYFLAYLSRIVLAVIFCHDHQERSSLGYPVKWAPRILRAPSPMVWEWKPQPSGTVSQKLCYESKRCWRRPIIPILLSWWLSSILLQEYLHLNNEQFDWWSLFLTL